MDTHEKTVLSQKLLVLGFFSALGTMENGPGKRGDNAYVTRGVPFTQQQNNGVLAVYDEAGKPWIIRAKELEPIGSQVDEMARFHQLKHGAYVPHSNDGGHFVCEVIPSL